MILIIFALASINAAMVPPHIQRGLMSPLNCVAARKGYDVCVETADITKFQGDAVVNAANEQLRHGGGVAAAFVRAGGESIQVESDENVRQFGLLPVAHTAVTGVGSLKSKHLIHVVGPMSSGVSSDAAKEDEQLRESVLNVLRTARRLCLRSVAIPLISSGIFGFTKERAAKIVVDAVFDFYEKSDKSDPAEAKKGRLPNAVSCDLSLPVPRHVVLMDLDKASVSAIKHEMKRYLHLAFGHRTEL